MVADEGETVKEGWENGVVQTISFMLKIKRESIKSLIDAERVRCFKRCIYIAIAVLLIFAGLTVWALRAEKKAQENADVARKQEAEAKYQAVLARKNEAVAKEQAVLAKQSFDFLGSVFKTANSLDSGNKDMKVLDAISKKIPEIYNLEKWQLKTYVSKEIFVILNDLQ